MSLLFNSKNKSKRPKFLLHLEIKELSNIPQSSGYCYVKWHLKDGTGTLSHSVKEVETADQQHVAVSNQSKGSTAHVLVRAHRARWNHRLEPPVKVKLAVDHERRLASKELTLDVYFEFMEGEHVHVRGNCPSPSPSTLSSQSGTVTGTGGSGGSVYTKKVSGKHLLGSVTTDLADYVNPQQEPVTKRLLLQRSKINSILTLSIRLQLIRGHMDDFILREQQEPFSGTGAGWHDVFEDGAPDMAPPLVVPQITRTSSPSMNNSSGNSAYHNGLSPARRFTKNDGLSMTFTNPVVEKLYQKSVEISWDPRPGEYSPRDCVEDILEGGDGWAKNERGLSLVDLQAARSMEADVGAIQRPRITRSGPSYLLVPPMQVAPAPFKSNIDRRDDWDSLSARQRKHIRIKNRKEGAGRPLETREVFDSDLSLEGSPRQNSDDRSWRVKHILP
ncbi:AaceriAGL291Wp [[Ashbya] aceris (nom. inval.)]|nr:AaceriAGL291Wp [[Ashbya] aceris (nom. inval.)]